MADYPDPFQVVREGCLGDREENQIVARIRELLGEACPPSPAGIGDDCAVLRPPLHPVRVATVDPVVYGVHFDRTAAPEQVARKLLARNLSDLAAMGAVPDAALLAIQSDPRLSFSWFEAFIRGIESAARVWAVPVVGGDLSSASPGCFIASLTLLGSAPNPVTRTGTRPGDRLWITGELGWSHLGHHLSFEPRVSAGRWLAEHFRPHAMMDISDGLSADLPRLLGPGLAAEIDPDELPLRFEGAVDSRTLAEALNRGEDYELCFTLSPDRSAALKDAWVRQFPKTRLTSIGTIFNAETNAPGIRLLGHASLPGPGFDHFRR